MPGRGRRNWNELVVVLNYRSPAKPRISGVSRPAGRRWRSTQLTSISIGGCGTSRSRAKAGSIVVEFQMLSRSKSAKVSRFRRLSTLPAFRPPQLATLQQHVPTDDEWLFELSYSGRRCQAAIMGRNVRLFNERGEDCSEQFGYLVPAFADLTIGTLLIDGEICALNDDGRSDPALLKRNLADGGPLVFFAFALLQQ